MNNKNPYLNQTDQFRQPTVAHNRRRSPAQSYNPNGTSPAYDPSFSFEEPSSEWTNPAANGREWDLWKLVNQILPLVRDQAQFAGSIEGSRQNAVRQTLQQLSPGNRQSQVDSFRRRTMARAKDQARQAAMSLAANGMGTGAAAGAQLDAVNRAASETAGFDASLNSYEGQMQALQAVLGAIQQGQNMSALGALLPLQDLAFSTDRMALQRGQTTGNGLGSVLGMIGGLLAPGGGAGSLFSSKPSRRGGSDAANHSALTQAVSSTPRRYPPAIFSLPQENYNDFY